MKFVLNCPYQPTISMQAFFSCILAETHFEKNAETHFKSGKTHFRNSETHFNQSKNSFLRDFCLLLVNI